MRKNINERGSDELNYSDNSVDEYKPLKLEYLQQNPQEVAFVINSYGFDIMKLLLDCF